MRHKTIASLSAAAMAAGLGFGLTQLANADTITPTPSASASASADAPGGAARGWRGIGGHGARGMPGADLGALAEKLGVAEDTLTDAVDAAREATRPASVPSRDETHEERAAARSQRAAEFVEALADELGVEKSTVQAAFDEIRAEHEAERTAADEEILDQAVMDGTLTRADADSVQKAIDAGVVTTHRGGPRH